MTIEVSMNSSPPRRPLHALFVHGMGRSSLNWWPMLRRFKRRGIQGETFGYSVFLRSFDEIVGRLRERIEATAEGGDYVVIGHSLGGVLLRAALAQVKPGTKMPQRLFLLGSPIGASRLAKGLRKSGVFPFLTQDCGRLLGSDERMTTIPKAGVPTTAIIGVKGWTGKLSPFGDEQNDGIVAVKEVSADWFDETIFVRELHTFLPMSKKVADLMIERMTNQFGGGDNHPAAGH